MKVYIRVVKICFGLFVRPQSHTYNTGHVNYSLQFLFYNTTYMDLHLI